LSFVKNKGAEMPLIGGVGEFNRIFIVHENQKKILIGEDSVEVIDEIRNYIRENEDSRKAEVKNIVYTVFDSKESNSIIYIIELDYVKNKSRWKCLKK
jgi:hypothetical protein